MIPARFQISPLTAVVLLHHVVNCDDADNDADRTVREIAVELDKYRSSIKRAVLESALYCCNMEEERGKFWHPFDHSFNRFIDEILPSDFHFDRYYNQIYEKKKQAKAQT